MSSQSEIKLPTWEVLALLIGYVSTVNDIPEIVNKILNCFPNNNITPEFNRWTMIGYGVLLIILSAMLLFKENFKRNEKGTTKAEEDDLKSIVRKIQFIRYVKSLGLDFIFDLIRHLAGIFMYDAFKRPDDWEDDKKTFRSMYRLWVNGGKSVEIRMRKDLSGYNLRTTDDEKFGKTKAYSFCRLKNKYLAFISFKIFIFSIAHILLLPFNKCIRGSYKRPYLILLGYFVLAFALYYYWPALEYLVSKVFSK